MSDDAGAVAGGVYSKFIQDRLDQEEKRASSLQARGIAIITTSGTLVTLTFAVGGAILRIQTNIVPVCARRLLVTAMCLFVVAAILGLASNFPRLYRRPSIKDLRSRTSAENWDKPRPEADQVLAGERVSELELAQEGLDHVSCFVRIGLTVEVVAIGFACGAMSYILLA